MSFIQTSGSRKIIPINIFETCLIDNKKRKEIIKSFPTRKNGAYYLDKFIKHLKINHNLTIKEYVKNYLEEKWPLCPITNEEVGYQTTGVGLIFSTFKQGKISKEHCEAFKKACDRLSQSRKGDKNPMFGKKPWNIGLTKENNEKMASIAKKKNRVENVDRKQGKTKKS